MSQTKGYVSFVLHAHLPFIHHPESEDYLEEQWLFEAISETYIPLLTNFEMLVNEGVDFRITMSLTPPLMCMLANELLQKRYIKYLEQHIELAKKEISRTTYDERINKLSKYYFNDELKIENGVINVPISSNSGSNIMVIYTDLFGNEFREEIKLGDENAR